MYYNANRFLHILIENSRIVPHQKIFFLNTDLNERYFFFLLTVQKIIPEHESV